MAFIRLFAYVVLFVIKCRFPSSKSIADIIRYRYNDDTISKVRRLERLDFKSRKCKLDVEFLEICLSNKLRTLSVIKNDGWRPLRTHTASRAVPDPMRITSPIKNNKILILC